MEGFKLQLLVYGVLLAVTTRSEAETSTCLTLYKEGGAPAVFQSPKCPRWKLSNYASRSPSTARCQSAMLQGRRNSQEDRTLCALDLRFPFPGTAIYLFFYVSINLFILCFVQYIMHSHLIQG